MSFESLPISGEVVLKPGREKPLLNRHHWIFSGAVDVIPDMEDGALAAVKSHDGRFLGHAYFNRRCSIVGRMLNFNEENPAQAVRRNVRRAAALRQPFFTPETNAYRLINAEADFLPGLIVDRYDDVLVVQITTLGLERMKPFLVDLLTEQFHPRCIVEKSNLPARREEGLSDCVGILYGPLTETVRIVEDGAPFEVDLVRSQKTGLFLDQREMRRLVREVAAGRRVLNAFCYTGGFSVAALRGQASRVLSVDASEPALELARRNVALNGFDLPLQDLVGADVFELLRREDLGDFDLIILDPPAFAKKREDVVPACRGYKDLNRLALKILSPGGLLLTFSCSHFVEEKLFRQVVFEAAAEAGRDVRLLQRHRQAFDHPLNIFHPESEYLKGFLLYVD
jgi:23S rRNA (cytosine1962-C5)-methyltransferase